MIKVTRNGDKVEITLDNGHASALAKVTSDYNIVSEEKALGFILSVMRDANGQAIETVNGSFVPAEGIKKSAVSDNHAPK